MAVLGDEDVRGLDVAVDDVGRVQELHGQQAVVQDDHHVVGVQLRLLFQVEQIFQVGAKIFHHDENAQLISVLFCVRDEQVEDLRGAEEVDLLLHCRELPQDLYLSDDLHAIVVPPRETIDVLDGHLLTGDFANTFHDGPVAPLAQYSVQGVGLGDQMPGLGQLGAADNVYGVRSHLLVLHVGRTERFVVRGLRPLINVDRNFALFELLKFLELAL